MVGSAFEETAAGSSERSEGERGEPASVAGSLAPSLLLDALARALSYPSEGIAATLEPLARAVEDDSLDLDEKARELAERVLKASSQFPDDTAEKLAYTRLFIGSLEMLAPPYASYYLSDDRTLAGRVAVEVAEVYRLFGVQLEEGEHAPADHLRYMLAFLALLAARFEETGDAAFAEAYCDFRAGYIEPWFDQFRGLVEQHADAPYYPSLVSLITKALGFLPNR